MKEMNSERSKKWGMLTWRVWTNFALMLQNSSIIALLYHAFQQHNHAFLTFESLGRKYKLSTEKNPAACFASKKLTLPDCVDSDLCLLPWILETCIIEQIWHKSRFQNDDFFVTDPGWNELPVQHTSYIQYLHDGACVQVAEKKWRSSRYWINI